MMTSFYPPNSRYYGLPIRTRERPDGTVDSFVGRRIIPATERYQPLDRYRTVDRDRIDNLSADTLGDPELYWRIVDANGDADPATATRPAGRLIIIPLPLEIADHGDT